MNTDASLTEMILLLSQSFIVIVSLITIINYIRYRDRARLDVALMFSSLGLGFLVGIIDSLLGYEDWAFGFVPFIAFSFQPYLLLRLVTHFRAAPQRGMRIATWSLVVSTIALIVFILDLFPESLLSFILFLIIFANFAATEAYASFLFVKEAISSVGIQRYRLRFVALGTMFLTVLFLLFIVAIILSVSLDFESTLLQIVFSFLLMGIAISYYLGFTPPQSLLRMWQLIELKQFLIAMARVRVGQRTDRMLNLLALTGSRVVGGSASMVAIQKGSGNSLRLLSGEKIELNNTILEEVWQSGTSTIVEDLDRLGQNTPYLLQDTLAKAAFIIPIQVSNQMFGLLFILLPHSSLFPDDDIHMLDLMVEQSETTLNLIQRAQAVDVDDIY